MCPGKRVLLGLSWLLLLAETKATVVLFGDETVSFPSIDASFTPAIPEAGIQGIAYAAEPLDACSPLNFNITTETTFAVVSRGQCTFEMKVRNAQDASFVAVIIFDKGDNLVTMSGNGDGISTYALFVTHDAGQRLLNQHGTVYILPGYRRKTWAIKWLILSVSLIVIAIVGALVTVLCCIRQHILAEAEKEAYNEKLLNDDDYILTREFIPDDLGPPTLGVQDVVTDTDGENSEFFHSEGPSDSDHASDVSVHALPR